MTDHKCLTCWRSLEDRRKCHLTNRRWTDRSRLTVGHMAFPAFHAALHITQPDSLRWLSQRRTRTPHLWGVRTQGAMTTTLNSVEIFVQCTYRQVSSSYVNSFGRYRVDKQTNTQTNRRRWKHPTLFAPRYDVG